MGTLFFFDQTLPATDLEAKDGEDFRQVEIFRPSGEEYIELRIGELNEEHQGRGYAIRFDAKSAKEFLESAERAFFYLGWVQ